MGMYHDRAGRELTLDEFLPLFDDQKYRRVARSEFSDGSYLSTVWLGINHEFGGGPPLIFETMYFGAEDEDEHTRRYSTEVEALAGHEEILDELLIQTGDLRSSMKELSKVVEELSDMVELGDRFKLMMED